MHHAEQIAVAKRLLNFIGTATTELSEHSYHQPITEYTSVETAAREQRVLFRERPLCLGLSNDLPKPGSYRAHDLTGVPILLVRDLTGQFKAFLNVCRHRGARLASGCGEARGFTCPYHAWVYGLDGALVNRPDEGSFADVARATHGLTALPALEINGLLMVCPTPGASLATDAGLGALIPELTAYKLENFQYYASRDLTRKMNWKLVVDTFLESYHFCVLHRDSICSIFYQNLATFDPYGEHLRLVSPRKTIESLPNAAENDWRVLPHVVIIYVLFPNTVLVWQGEQIELWQIYPGATPNESTFRLTLYSPEPALTEKARKHWDKNLELVLHVVENEDFPVGEGIQQGMASQAQDHTVFGRNEPGLSHFHRMVTAALG
jgi:phenylpropionate dioxygenase-like ring-hydroxylating dioxygenase large terminal subunit